MASFREWLEENHPELFDSNFDEWLQVSQNELPANAALVKFIFRVRTSTGGLIGNILIEAKSLPEAVEKLRQRYPNSQILDCEIG
jgi:hypothetical protein